MRCSKYVVNRKQSKEERAPREEVGSQVQVLMTLRNQGRGVYIQDPGFRQHKEWGVVVGRIKKKSWEQGKFFRRSVRTALHYTIPTLPYTLRNKGRNRPTQNWFLQVTWRKCGQEIKVKTVEWHLCREASDWLEALLGPALCFFLRADVISWLEV